MITILIADDHILQRVGLKLTLEGSGNIKVLDEVGNATDLIDRAVELRPAVTLVDISMPGVNGLEAIRCLKSLLPQTKSIVMTCHEESAYADAAIEAGADGFLSKDAEPAELFAAIEAVASGGSWFASRELVRV